MSNSEEPISLNEHLSAMLDDEAGSFEEKRILNELKSDEQLSKKLANYALIGETLRSSESNQPALIAGSSFLDNIHQKIALEDQFDEVSLDEAKLNPGLSNLTTTNSSSPSMLRPIGGFAIAASFGALAFMGLQNMGVLTGPSGQQEFSVDRSGPTAIAQQVVPAQEAVATKPVASVSSSDDDYVDADAKTRSLLKRYVDSHMQQTTASNFVPSVRVIAYTGNQ